MKMLNKIIGTSIAVAAALAFSESTTQAQPNLLVNGGFENPAGFTANPITLTSGPGGSSGVNQGWATYNTSGQSDMSSSSDSPYDGSYVLQLVSNPGQDYNPSGAYQVVSGITPGTLYTFGVWALTDTGASVNNNYATPLLMSMDFETADPSATPLGSVEIPWGWYPPYYSESGGPALDAALPANDQWVYYSIQGTAPVGAVDAVVYLQFMENGGTTVDNLYFDDASLTAPVPEPSSLALLSMGLAVPFYFIRRRKS
ncbi:MAG: PEP-CTERM sorting domain-containing protein [Verrucomicrobiia bacterium]